MAATRTQSFLVTLPTNNAPWTCEDVTWALQSTYKYVLGTRGSVSRIDDARLVTAAKDMLEALEEVREAIEGRVDIVDGDSGPGPNWAMRLMRTVEAAIVKAGGAL